MNSNLKIFTDVVSYAILFLGPNLMTKFYKGLPNMSEQTLFEKYGGFSQISKVVLSFYDTLLDSDEIGPFFDNTEMSKMVDHQTKFIASLLGGPASYTDNQLRQLHSHLEIEHAHFDELKVVLRNTLSDHNIESNDVDTILAEFEKRREIIVG